MPAEPFLILLTAALGCTSGGGGSPADGADGCLDADRDGHRAQSCGGDDCEDADATVHPGAIDFGLDGVDRDCSGSGPADVDGDGAVDRAHGGDDCDDADAQIHPGAADAYCDGIDQDCDGRDDADGDGDGAACAGSGGDDCDDADADVHPGANDVACDGIDQDCDGRDLVDGDGDGHACKAAGGDDCDDASAAVSPGAPEVYCNDVDEDCDGADLADLDGDEAKCDADCDDSDWRAHPGAVDAYCDGVDQDCDGHDFADRDGDGHECPAAGGDDCDEDDASVHPGALTVACDGTDQDCDGLDEGLDEDNDGDGVLCRDDCDDQDPAVRPGAIEADPVVDTVPVGGARPSVVVDARGAVHVALLRGPNCWIRGDGRCYWVHEVLYATNASGDWIVETVEPHAGKPGEVRSVEIRVDATGAPHVVYSGYDDAFEIGMYYSTNASGVWSRTRVESAACLPALALDAGGAAHVTCGVGSSHHYTNASGGWVEEATVADTPDGAALVEVDAFGAAHLVYGDLGDLRHATDASGDWESELVAADAFEDQIFDFAVSPDGIVHVGWQQSRNGLEYATHASGVWVTETVDSEDRTGDYVSLALDADGAVHMSYADRYIDWDRAGVPNEGGHLRWASNANGDWVLATVDAGPIYDTSLAAGPDGALHVAFFEREGGDLRHGLVTEAPDGVDRDCDGFVW